MFYKKKKKKPEKISSATPPDNATKSFLKAYTKRQRDESEYRKRSTRRQSAG